MYNELIWQQYIDRVSETGDLLLQAWRLNKLPFYHVSSMETDGVFSMWDIAPSTHMGGELYGYKLRPPTEVVEMLKDAGFKRAQFSVMPYAKIAKSFKQVVSKQDTEAFLKETLPILYVATKE